MNGTDRDFLNGQLLIAMPNITDPRFKESVVYMCVHTEERAMGVIVNKSIDDLDFTELMEQLHIDQQEPEARPVMFGGPVEPNRGFVLHTLDYHSDATLVVTDRIGLTGSREILEAIARGGAPRQALLALGYAGWGGGQLESEIRQNAWLHCDGESDIVFDGDFGAKWRRAMSRIGVDPTIHSGHGFSADDGEAPVH